MAESFSRGVNKRRHRKNGCDNQHPNDFVFSDSEVEAAMQLIQLSEEDSDGNYSAGSRSSSIGNCSTGVAESIIASNSVTGNGIKHREEKSEADPATPSSRAIRMNNIFTRDEEEEEEEEEGEDQSDGYSKRRKTMKKLRSVYEIYSLTKPVVVCK